MPPQTHGDMAERGDFFLINIPQPHSRLINKKPTDAGATSHPLTFPHHRNYLRTQNYLAQHTSVMSTPENTQDNPNPRGRLRDRIRKFGSSTSSNDLAPGRQNPSACSRGLEGLPLEVFQLPTNLQLIIQSPQLLLLMGRL